MSFVLDIVGFLLLISSFLLFWKRPWKDGLLSVGVLLVSLLVAVFACKPVSTQWIRPALTESVERDAANELADLFSAPHYENAHETVAGLSFDQKVSERPVAYIEILRRYSADADAVESAYSANPFPVVLLQSITQPWIALVADTLSFTVLWLVTFFLCWIISKRIAHNLPPPSPVRGISHLASGLLGVVYGFLLLVGLSLFLQWFFPILEARTMLATTSDVDSSLLFSQIRQFNPLYFWLFG